MLLTDAEVRAIVEGRIDTVFRVWRKPTVKSGGRLRTRSLELAIDDVAEVDEDDVTDEDAKRSQFGSRTELLEAQEKFSRPDCRLYRIRLHLAGRDRRADLRERAAISDDEIADLTRHLDRLDRASRRGPWTAATLRLIEQRPATLAAHLALEFGQDTAWFKGNVRKLKELGLTESLKVGYRLSRRGLTFVQDSRRER